MSDRSHPWVQVERSQGSDRAGPLQVHMRTTHVRVGPTCWVHSRPTSVVDTRTDETIRVRDPTRAALGALALVGTAALVAGMWRRLRRTREGSR